MSEKMFFFVIKKILKKNIVSMVAKYGIVK